MVFPHSVWRKDITNRRPTTHPSYRQPIRNVHPCPCTERDKHPGKPQKCKLQGFAPTEAGRDVRPIGSQILADVAHSQRLRKLRQRTPGANDPLASFATTRKSCDVRLRA